MQENEKRDGISEGVIIYGANTGNISDIKNEKY